MERPTEALNGAANAVLMRMHCQKCPSKDEACDECAAMVGAVIREARSRFQPLADEIDRARTKFPGTDHLTAALTEEVGETAQAYLQGRLEDARAEAVQAACVAWRIVEEGDREFEPEREERP